MTGRQSFSGLQEADLNALAQVGKLVLILDGRNELDAPSRKRAAAEIKALQREFTGLSIVVTTRRQALDV